MRSAARKSASPSPTSAEIDPDERHARKIVPFGDHLRADENVDRAGRHRSKNIGRCALAAHRVAIEPCHARRRPQCRDFLRDLLGAETAPLEIRTLARRARLGHERPVVAVMAPGAMAIAPFRVHDERHAAVRALDGATALPAEHRRRQPAAIQQNERLLPCLEPLRDGVFQPPAENHVGAVLGIFLAHVDDGDRRERAILHAPLHDEARVSRACRILAAFERRRRRSEHDERSLVASAHNRHVAPVVARRLLLLERRVVLFVDDDQPKVVEGGKHGRARTDDDRHLAAPDAIPLIGTLAIGESAVLHGHAIAECVAKRRGHRRREGDLRNEHEHRLASAQHEIGKPEIHLCLAGSGDPLQQKHRERSHLRGRGKRV